jgi:hypothetical protein
MIFNYNKKKLNWIYLCSIMIDHMCIQVQNTMVNVDNMRYKLQLFFHFDKYNIYSYYPHKSQLHQEFVQ